MLTTWLSATIDVPDESFGNAKAFWGAVTGYRPNLGSDNDPNYALLQPQVGTPYLWLQRLIDGEPGVHLDLHIGPGSDGRVDLAAVVADAEQRGARVVAHTTYAVLRSPGGVAFCLIPDLNPDPPTAPGPARWPGGHSLVDRLSLNVDAASWETEVAFWSGFTGWSLSTDEDGARLDSPTQWPLHVVVRPRGSGEAEAHLEVSCDDRDAEVARWQDAGARAVERDGQAITVETPGEVMARLRPLDADALPAGEYAFPGPLRDQLVAAILDGSKTSTTSLVVDYERHGEALPQVGEREAVVDSAGVRVCITQVTDVQVCSLAEVTLDHVIAEGEGFDSVALWRSGHEAFWHSDEFRADLGDPSFTVDDATQAVCVTFEVVARL